MDVIYFERKNLAKHRTLGIPFEPSLVYEKRYIGALIQFYASTFLMEGFWLKILVLLITTC